MNDSDKQSGLEHELLAGHAEANFDFTEEDRDGYVMLRPSGGICNATVKLIKGRLYDLCSEYGCKIIMSMKDVDFIDSVGLGTMIAAHKSCDHYGGRIVYCGMNPMIMKNMEFLRMDQFLDITPDIASAEALLE